MMNSSPHIIQKVRFKLRIPSSQNEKEVMDFLSDRWTYHISTSLEQMLDRLIPANQHYRIPELRVKVPLLNTHIFADEFEAALLAATENSLKEILRSNSKNQVLEVQNSHSGSLDKQIFSDKENTKEWSQEAKKINGHTQTEIQKHTQTEKISSLFLFFLEKGHFPWWATKEDRALMEQEVEQILSPKQREKKENKPFVQRLKQLLISKEQAHKRLIKQFSPKIKEVAFQAIENESSPQNLSIIEAFNSTLVHLVEDLAKQQNLSTSDAQKALVYVKFRLLLELEGGKINTGKLNSFIKKKTQIQRIFSTYQNKKSQVDIESDENKIAFLKKMAAATASNVSHFKEEKEAYYIHNAGLVLFNPFLQHFFEHAGLLENNTFIDAFSQDKGVHLLQFLISGEEHTPEEQLMLNKILCGLPLEQPIERDIVLTEADKELCHSLMNAVIKHWEVLGEVSPSWLRQSFLVREGKLQINDSDYELTIANQAQDLLLAKLMWNFSVIKLPWMEKMLQTEWAY